MNRKLASAIGDSDLANFDGLSNELSETEAGLRLLRGEINEHQSQTGHDPLGAPADTPSVPMQDFPSHAEVLMVCASLPPDRRGTGDVGITPKVRLPDVDREVGFCEEKHQLLDDFLQAVRELNALLDEQSKSLIAGDPDFSRFDVLIHMAHQKKENAKYRWMAHVEAHHCEGA